MKSLNTTEKLNDSRVHKLAYFTIVIFFLVYEYFFSWAQAAILDERGRQLIEGSTTSFSFLFDLLFFFLAHLMIQFGAILISLLSASTSVRFFKINFWQSAAIIYILLKLTILYFNSIYYPKSNLAWYLSSFLLSDFAYYAILLTSILLFMVAPVIQCIHWFNSKVNLSWLKNWSLPKAGVTIGALAFAVGFTTLSNFVSTAETEKKNVVLIGLDSISREHLYDNLEHLPNMAKIVNSGYSFKNATTPLARTFPSWNSVLTGLLPAEHKGVFNLTPSLVANKDTIAKSLKQQGYQTIYAQDERRFNNIDESWGFEDIVGPEVGAADFILPALADLPIANMLYGTWLGEKLFPFIALNRVSFLTYYPHRFTDSIIKQIDETKPLFLASHHCLAHIPFTWARSQSPKSHLKSMKAADRQVGHLLAALEEKGILENTLLVLFSDHGESTRSHKESYYSDQAKFVGTPGTYHDHVEIVFFSKLPGHGVNVNSKSQYNSFLILKDFSEPDHQPSKISQHISLTKIHDVIKANLSGQSLEKIVSELKNNPEPVFVESGLMFSSVQDPENVDREKLLEEVAHLYRINNSSGYLELKESSIDALIKTKHTGVFWGEWALFKLVSRHTEYVDILVNLESGEWTYDFETEFVASAPIEKLEHLLQEYRDKLGLTAT